MRRKIDVHAHYLPDFYRQALAETGHSHPDGMPTIPDWSEATHLEMMDALNITTSILSLSSPGTHLTPGDDGLATNLARRCNRFAAELKQRHPGRFGFFAELPLPSVDGALAEMAASWAAGCDGVALKTNYHGVYLGDERLAPVMAELDRRHAIVFVHPTTGCVCATPEGSLSSVVKVNPLDQLVPAPVLEFFFDTTRAVAQLCLSGALARYANITWIFPHAGGAVPPLLSRVTGFAQAVQGQGHLAKITEEEVVRVFNERCYFDLAGWAFPSQWNGLVHGLGVGFDRLLYGSDFPFTNAKFVTEFAAVNDDYVEIHEEWSEERQEMAWYGNARRLFEKRAKPR